jgi:hypothetical protein
LIYLCIGIQDMDWNPQIWPLKLAQSLTTLIPQSPIQDQSHIWRQRQLDWLKLHRNETNS